MSRRIFRQFLTPFFGRHAFFVPRPSQNYKLPSPWTVTSFMDDPLTSEIGQRSALKFGKNLRLARLSM
jgi:hypothetical protein